MPDGRVVPRVAHQYTYLGAAEPAVWEDAQEGVRKHVVRTCEKLMRMLSGHISIFVEAIGGG